MQPLGAAVWAGACLAGHSRELRVSIEVGSGELTLLLAADGLLLARTCNDKSFSHGHCHLDVFVKLT